MHIGLPYGDSGRRAVAKAALCIGSACISSGPKKEFTGQEKEKMLLNGNKDALAIPVETLKKACDLMRRGLATRKEIAVTLAAKMKRHGGYARLERVDRVIAIEWRLECADPSHPSHALHWEKLLGHWRQQRYRAKEREKRAADPAFDAAFRAKRREEAARRKAANPELIVKHRATYHDRKARIIAEDPAVWEAEREVARARNREYYLVNREEIIEKRNARVERLRIEEPEEYVAWLENRRARTRAYAARNREKAREREAAYRAANPEKIKAKNQRYWARRKAREEQEALCNSN